MRMTPALLLIGGLMVFWASVYIMLVMPVSMYNVQPSETWRPLTAQEQDGLQVYVSNGCSYCHSQFVRVLDWGEGASRIAQPGDYVGVNPAILGTERIGPDLSQEGGEHSDDWHAAHFANPRNTSPLSLMPSWEFLGEQDIKALTAYMQAEGGKLADARMLRQEQWKRLSLEVYKAGADRNIAWLHGQVPQPWRAMPNPYPATEEAVLRGQKMYQEFCMGCHGSVGDGQGQGAKYFDPPPLNFTSLRRNLIERKYIGGILYYQIMNGVTGTGMPYFKKALESEKIWAISNYVAVSFIGYTDAQTEPVGIDASYEPAWVNPYGVPEPNGISKDK
jgi:cytochrome c oxidase cbb3-type subunit II